jgi:NAD(P)-dependent dehydrogenase (short-subunit alcohol dehydrogenase family)
MELRDRNIVITGGASGIGAAMARRFADDGARGIVVADLQEELAREVADSIGDQALAVPCNVSDPEQVDALIATAEDAFGPVDIVCANAGIGTGQGESAPDEIWDQIIGVNVLAHVYAARRLLPGWLERGEGYFVSTASAAGLLSQIGDAPYAVTKHAAVAFAEWLSITYGDRGIRVSCLCPMGVDTPLVRMGLDLEGDESLGARVVAAAGTLLPPEQVADDVAAAIRAEQFLILPHPEVGEFYRRKGDDPDRWLAGMRRLQRTVTGG